MAGDFDLQKSAHKDAGLLFICFNICATNV